MIVGTICRVSSSFDEKISWDVAPASERADLRRLFPSWAELKIPLFEVVGIRKADHAIFLCPLIKGETCTFQCSRCYIFPLSPLELLALEAEEL